MFSLRGAHLDYNALRPEAQSYIPNLGDYITDLNINVVYMYGGPEGNLWEINIINHPLWAENLDTLLTATQNLGVKVILSEQGLATAWGHWFGISPETTTIEEAKALINKLAADNSLAHNFITDPRVFGWRVANEVDLAINTTREWCLAISDYVRSKGGKAWIGSPRWINWWEGQKFSVIEPVVRGHVDYLDRHIYNIDDFQNINYDYTTFYNAWKNWLTEHMIDGRGAYDLDHIILGEFGIWHGYGSDVGATGTFNDQQCADYYRACLDTCRDLGLKNVAFHSLDSPKDWQGTPMSPEWGIINPDGLPYPLVYDVVKKAYTPTPIPPIIPIVTPFIFGGAVIGLAEGVK